MQTDGLVTLNSPSIHVPFFCRLAESPFFFHFSPAARPFSEFLELNSGHCVRIQWETVEVVRSSLDGP